MILCVDCGNTSIKIGLFENDQVVKVFKLKTDRNKSSDEYALSLTSLVKGKVDGAIISSVVPLVTPLLRDAIKESFNVAPMILSKKLKTKLPIKIDNPNELGSDMLAGAIGAKTIVDYPFVVADLGTATKLYVVDKNGYFVGGVITAGMEISLKALVGNTAQLLETPIVAPNKIIGTNTKDCIQSGIVFGQAYMVSEFARRMEKELGYGLKRVLTGGFAEEIKDEIVCFDYDENLVLKGLYQIYLINKEIKNEK